jgi:hypothetical protein
MIIACSSSAFAGGISDLPWNESNIQTLRALDKSAVVGLLSDLWNDNHPFSIPKARDIGEFAWADLAGDRRYELVVTLDVNGRAFFNALMIYSRDSSGKISTREIDGWMISDLGKVIQDLKGDGKDELIIPTVLISYSTAETSTWPAVYRLENGKYVEASSEFPRYYDDKVLPQLNKEINDARAKVPTGLANDASVALPMMVKDKILRITGHDPTAGLQQAYQWMNSDDPRLLQDAAATFQDIGGHEQEKRAAGDAAAAAWERERAARQGG